MYARVIRRLAIQHFAQEAGFRAGQPGLATDVFGEAAACAWFRQRIAQARLLTARRDVEVEQGAAVARDGVAQLGGEGIDQAALDAGLRDHAFALPRVFDAGRVAPACDHRLERSAGVAPGEVLAPRSEEHTSELQSLMRISYDVFCLKKNKY